MSKKLLILLKMKFFAQEYLLLIIYYLEEFIYAKVDIVLNSLGQKVLVNLLTFAAITIGVIVTLNMRREAMPVIDIDYATWIT